MKCIALVLESIAWSFDAAIVQSLGACCRSAGCRLMVYEARSLHLDHLAPQLIRHGAEGVVLMAESISLSDTREALHRFTGSVSLPCVSIGLRFPGIPCVTADNRAGMTLLLEHLRAQGATRIAHISGPVQSREAVERKGAYLAYLAQEGLSFHPDWVVEGNFSPVGGYDALRRLMPAIRNGEIDAVTFPNDESALGGLQLLDAEAVEVPGKLLVTGYGDTANGLMTVPGLTTISNNPDALALACLHLLTDRHTATDAMIVCPPLLQPNVSTGAPERTAERRALLRRAPLISLYLQENYSDTVNPEAFWAQVGDKLQKYGISALYAVRHASSENPAADNGEDATSVLLYGYAHGVLLPAGTPFPAADLLPGSMLPHQDEPLLFHPIQFGDKPYGYLLTTVDAYDPRYLGDLSAHCIGWLEAASREAEQDLYRKRISDTMSRLMMANRKLNELTVRSNLDGTAPNAGLAFAQQDDTRYLLFLLDIDGLRHINERFGYSEGDHVLDRTEKALRHCVRDTDRVLRQGGDTFMLLIKGAGPRMVGILQERLLAQLDRLNMHLDKGYRIDFTWGHACGDGNESFEQIIQRADEMLYRKKQERISVQKSHSMPADPSRSVPADPSRSVPADPSRRVAADPSRHADADRTRVSSPVKRMDTGPGFPG